MGVLSDLDKARYALAHGHLFSFVCDTPDCGKLIRSGELCVVTKWEKRTDGLQAIMGRIPVKVRCMDCERALHPPKETVKVKGAGRGAAKVPSEIAAGLKIDPIVRRVILKLLKASPSGIPVKELITKLRRKKIIRAMKKRDVSTTIRSMKKLKLLKKKAGVFILPIVKLKKVKAQDEVAPTRRRKKKDKAVVAATGSVRRKK